MSSSITLGSMQKQIIEVPAEFVDAANDSLKWLIVLLVSLVYSQQMASRYGAGGLGSSSTLRMTLTTAAVTAVGLFIYHFVVQKFVMFMPQSGQSTYYMALKRT
jgi:ABC-type methionine transport system permease subunit